MSDALTLRAQAAELADSGGDLLLEAERLSRSLIMGEHGRRKAGLGDHFWQYRPFENGVDSPRSIDHRRSAQQDQYFVRQLEWKTPQALHVWVDQSASMRFASKGNAGKNNRAAILVLAIAIAAEKAGERVGLCDSTLAPSRGRKQILQLAKQLNLQMDTDYSLTGPAEFLTSATALIASDFLSKSTDVESILSIAADRGVRGVLLQVLDPLECSFPFQGRALFQSVLGSVEHDTLQAADLKSEYLKRLADRQQRLGELADMARWDFLVDDGSFALIITLSKIYQSLSKGRTG
ncbi:DUF58 domain-containing protein [Paracoccaceae bacterium]|nr:DUF58 domain-containing protein [Paracoccaceae bacterium]